jgi:lipopolysaccharide transport system permease protein
MIAVVRRLYDYRELLFTLAWKNIAVRYKQAYLGLLWAVLRPLLLMLVFTVMRSFVGIESGSVPYPVLTFAALLPWTLFQDSTSESVNSVVSNAHIIRKIYFPREILPLTALLTKLVELAINFVILAGLMAYYDMGVTLQVLWVPLIIAYTLLATLCVGFAGAAANVFYRDASTALPIALSLLMYLSPIIYPLELVRRKFLEEQAVGEWSDLLFTLYTCNPLAGIIDGFQSALLQGKAPDPAVMLPGAVVVLLALPVSYLFFKHAERRFADII